MASDNIPKLFVLMGAFCSDERDDAVYCKLCGRCVRCLPTAHSSARPVLKSSFEKLAGEQRHFFCHFVHSLTHTHAHMHAALAYLHAHAALHQPLFLLLPAPSDPSPPSLRSLPSHIPSMGTLPFRRMGLSNVRAVGNPCRVRYGASKNVLFVSFCPVFVHFFVLFAGSKTITFMRADLIEKARRCWYTRNNAHCFFCRFVTNRVCCQLV